MIKVYLAGPYEYQKQLQTTRDLFQTKKNLFQITSRWLDQKEYRPSSENLAISANKNYEDINASRVLIVLNPSGWENQGTGGRHIEVGYALGRGIPVINYGYTLTAMYHHPLIVHMDGDLSWVYVMELVEKIYIQYWQGSGSLEGIGDK